jgi:hypothetical protein
MLDIDKVFAAIDLIDNELCEKEKELDIIETRLEKLSSYS